MILDVDVGNTRVKWRLVDGDLCQRGDWSRTGKPAFPDVAPEAVRVSSVAGYAYEGELSSQIRACLGVEPWFARTQPSCLGLYNSYENPNLMGADRWLAMLAAWHRVQGPVCVVDAGSALTIDLVAGDGHHQGGYIIPGRQSMVQSLLSGTDRVRFDDLSDDALEPGRSTGAAVGNGAWLTMVGAVERAVDLAAGEPSILVCGGDAEALCKFLALPCSHQPDLVFDGLALAAENS